MLVTFLEAKKSVAVRTLAYILLIVPPIINTTDRMAHLSGDLTRMRSRWAIMERTDVRKIFTSHIVDDTMSSTT